MNEIKHNLYTIDSFTSRPFEGNPAAVVFQDKVLNFIIKLVIFVMITPICFLNLS